MTNIIYDQNIDVYIKKNLNLNSHQIKAKQNRLSYNALQNT